MHPYASQPSRGVPPWVLLVLGAVIIGLVTMLAVVLSQSDGKSGSSGGNFQGQEIRPGSIGLANEYQGTSRNKTLEQPPYQINGRASLSLKFTSKDDPRALRGRLLVYGNPYVGGSGAFEGTLTGSRIDLVVQPDSDQDLLTGTLSYRLVGEVQSDGTIKGQLIIPGQVGSWEVSPVNL